MERLSNLDQIMQPTERQSLNPAFRVQGLLVDSLMYIASQTLTEVAAGSVRSLSLHSGFLFITVTK